MASLSQTKNGFGSSRSILGVMDQFTKKPMKKIPENYIRPEQEPSTLSHGTHPLPTIPIIDMNYLSLQGDAADNFELEKMHSKCKEWGFFQLVNHGVSFQLLENLKQEIENFFKLSSEEKLKYKIRPGDVEGYGTVIRCEDQKLDWGDRFYMILNPVHRRKPYLFPELPSSFRSTLDSYYKELQKLAMKLLGLLGKAINMEMREVEDLFEDGMQSMRMTYYPPCPQPELVMGLTPHSDATGITILHQINGVEGLEIKKDGIWIPVNFLQDAFVVNVGDIMEILSNGVYSSIEHRATVNKVKERISIAMFFNPKFEAEIGPARSLISQQNPPLFRRVLMEEYFREFFSRNLNGKAHLEKMRITSGEGNTIQ
ncbi:2-oxoglutarate (2OG) and Fe(II)-dependent oxygenase superfamily protein [Quillaja saponaria]|uniref:2-oxoglutarate (2OG) and Fe(II)-dependent oxygenase superfamily protein n=1 Tax=Quillaja saponaria TaxID=32244 RepID=A0AAD7KPD7_QUISA|nr:2-oxoglutarate (2OG) and Fe(II)-dependent oxygenase superfamily protein [Quillaja saponaria]